MNSSHLTFYNAQVHTKPVTWAQLVKLQLYGHISNPQSVNIKI